MHRLLAVLLLAIPALVLAGPLELPPQIYHPAKAAIEPQMLGNAATPAYRLTLPPPAAGEFDALKRSNQAAGKNRPLQIGFGREIGGSQQLAFDRLNWVDTEGGQLARIAVGSPTAAALRVELKLHAAPEGLELRFQGSARDQVFGPVSSHEAEAQGGYWSPVMEGETGLIELFLPAGTELGGARIDLLRVSHLVVAGLDLHPSRLKTLGQIGDGDSCNSDVACVNNPSSALLNARDAVAHMVFNSGSSTYVCTGTLLNSVYSNGTPTGLPYFYTAYHCIGTQSEASTLNTYWFFEAASCGSTATPSGYRVVGGGATLLYAVFDTDISFMQLNNSPPSGVVFAGWKADPIASGSAAMTLHHPAGDLKKITQGTTQGYGQYGGGRSANFITIRYFQGSTQGGSSGAGLFTYNAGGYYQLRGGLLGGVALCTNMSGLDYYSPMDQAIGSLAQWLTPSSGNTGATQTVWEFYNTPLNHYFITADAGEASQIDAGGAGPGWSRTGQSFKSYPLNGASGSPVCRFYGPSPVNSHFYTVNAGECDYVKTIGGWVFEGHRFNIGVPVETTCATGMVPVYRAYNNGYATGAGANHRYTTSNTIYQNMQSAGWLPEGVVFCAPQ